MRSFRIQLLFQVATEIYLAANNNTFTKLAKLNSSGECTIEKKSGNYQCY